MDDDDRGHEEVQGGERKLLATGLRSFIDQAKKSINKQLRDKSNKKSIPLNYQIRI